MNLKILVKLIEPKSFAASILPVAFGSVIAWTRFYSFHFIHFLLLMLGMVLIQSVANMINDYSDYKRSSAEALKGDEKALSSGEVSLPQVKALIIIFSLIALAIGLYFSAVCSWWILAVIGISAFVMVTYSAGPLPLSYTPLGEAAAGLTMGLGITATVIYIQASVFNWTTVLFSMPTVLFIAALLLANNLGDWKEDRMAGRKTSVICMGPHKGTQLWMALMTLMLVLTWIMGLLKFYPMILPLIVTLVHPYGLMIRFNDTFKHRETKKALMGMTTLIGLRYHVVVMIVLMAAKVMGY